MGAARSSSLLHRLLARLQGTEEPAKRPGPVVKPKPFQAVAVFHGASCCQMARRFGEHRFLAKDAPSLPLPGCTMPHQCTCRFMKFGDRREMRQRRLLDSGLASQLFAGNERRFRRGRRASDR